MPNALRDSRLFAAGHLPSSLIETRDPDLPKRPTPGEVALTIAKKLPIDQGKQWEIRGASGETGRSRQPPPTGVVAIRFS
jgi:hypothetical protein